MGVYVEVPGMTQLYTSIAHTKIAMQNGGAPPPVTQFAREWRDRSVRHTPLRKARRLGLTPKRTP